MILSSFAFFVLFVDKDSFDRAKRESDPVYAPKSIREVMAFGVENSITFLCRSSVLYAVPLSPDLLRVLGALRG